jgi:hypothetical protein
LINHAYVTAIVPTSTHTFTGGRIASQAPNTCQSKPPYNQSYVYLFILHQAAKWLLRHISRSCVYQCKIGLLRPRAQLHLANRYTLFSRHVLVQYTCSLERVAIPTRGHGRAAKAKHLCSRMSVGVSSSSPPPSLFRSILSRTQTLSFNCDRSIDQLYRHKI